MDDEPTCGKGIAANSVLPARLADLLTALADTLQAHRPALDRSEPAGREEDDAYAVLVAEFQDIARRLAVISQRMTGYRTLPMARHDEAVMADPERMAPYARFVEIERDLAAMLSEAAAAGEEMLRES